VRGPGARTRRRRRERSGRPGRCNRDRSDSALDIDGFDDFGVHAHLARDRGREYYWDAAGVYWGNDNWRTSAFATLIREGYTRQLLASQDVCFKMDLRTYGGYGYDHLLVDIVPALLRAGVSATDLDTVFTTNPANVLKH
jgi:predicted metal-dependent phosphotriesterase family hydrolase